jgi:NAD-dependent dihydropyrimidine dehydrogenase PreA subunit
MASMSGHAANVPQQQVSYHISVLGRKEDSANHKNVSGRSHQQHARSSMHPRSPHPPPCASLPSYRPKPQQQVSYHISVLGRKEDSANHKKACYNACKAGVIKWTASTNGCVDITRTDGVNAGKPSPFHSQRLSQVSSRRPCRATQRMFPSSRLAIIFRYSEGRRTRLTISNGQLPLMGVSI